MLSLAGVMVAMAILLSLTNLFFSIRTIHNILDFLVEHDGLLEVENPKGDQEDGDDQEYGLSNFLTDVTGRDEFAFQSPEFRFSTRYFSVVLSADGAVTDFKDNHIASVTREDAAEYAKRAVAGRQSFGRIGIYYYKVAAKDSGSVLVVFLDSWNQMRSTRRLLYSAMILMFAGTLLTFIFVVILSDKAIQPEIQNAERQKQFITDASHELKTPLAVIRANTEMQEILTGETEWTQSTLHQVDRLDGLIRNLVTITRTMEKETGEETDVDVRALIEESVHTFQSMAIKRGLNLTSEVDGQLRLHAVAAEISQLLGLLIDNALKYCDPDGNIHVNANKKGRGSIQIVVSNDYAAGANVDYKRFFERFYREDASRNVDCGGYGIGLSIAENLVSRYRGTIDVNWFQGRIYFTCILR